MKCFKAVVALILGNFAFITVAGLEVENELDLPPRARVDRRLAPSPPIATDSAGATVTVAVTATVTMNPASGGESVSTTISLSSSKGSSETFATAPDHKSTSPAPLFPATTGTSSLSLSPILNSGLTSGSIASTSESASKISSATDSKSTAAAGAPTPMAVPVIPGLGALAAVLFGAVAVF